MERTTPPATPTPTPNFDVSAERRALVDGLVEAHQTTLAAHMQDAVIEGLVRGTRLLGWGGLVYFAWRALAAIGGFDPLVRGWWVVVLGVVATAVVVVMHVLAERKEARPLQETAERLDLAAGTKNRIASALDLSSRRVGPFEYAAIQDGVAALERAKETEPYRAAPTPLPLGPLGFAYAGLILMVVALYLPFGRAPNLGAPPARSVAAVGDTDDPRRAVGDREPERKPGDATPPRRDEVDPPKSDRRDVKPPGTSQQRSATKSSGKRQEASGKPGKGKSGEARDARQASTSRGEPTEGETPESAPQNRRPRKRPKKKKKAPTDTRMIAKKKQEGQQSGATVGQAGSGGGAMSPVKSPWSQRDRGDDEPLPENPSEEDIDDEIEQEEARGGTQPSLRDRRAGTSRDLSISQPGEGGDGRGGPTPQKKSRGTASLVMGIPVPDFVRGLLNPGTTKVTHERVEPMPSPTAPRAAVRVAGRQRREPLVETTRFRAGSRAIVRRFLRALHDRSTGLGAPDPR